MADTGGRPLGLEVCADGSVLGLRQPRGLLRVDPASSVVEVLVAAVDGGPLNFASNVVVDGRRHDVLQRLDAALRPGALPRRHPRALRHRAAVPPRSRRRRSTTLLDGLDFANGVVFAPDRSCVLVAQTGRYCVTRYWLSGPAAGTSDTLIDNLPGFPDNMALGSDGLVWISLPTARNPLLDRLLPLPGVLRQLVWLVPERVQPKPAEDGLGAGRCRSTARSCTTCRAPTSATRW